MNITEQQVVDELLTIAKREPERSGKTGDEGVCQYFLKDNPYNEPICIVGQWLVEFHPELLENEDIMGVVERNDGAIYFPFDEVVCELLGKVQKVQDASNAVWDDVAHYLEHDYVNH